MLFTEYFCLLGEHAPRPTTHPHLPPIMIVPPSEAMKGKAPDQMEQPHHNKRIHFSIRQFCQSHPFRFEGCGGESKSSVRFCISMVLVACLAFVFPTYLPIAVNFSFASVAFLAFCFAFFFLLVDHIGECHCTLFLFGHHLLMTRHSSALLL